MELFFTLLLKIVPLYVLLFLGYLSARLLNVRKESIGNLLIYFIAPAVFFVSILEIEITLSVLSIIALSFVITSTIGIIFFYIARIFWSGKTANIVGFAAGVGNTGYFGIPVYIALFGDAHLGAYLLFVLGGVLYQSTVGFYIAATGKFSARESLKKVASLPVIWAGLVAIILSKIGWQAPKTVEDLGISFQGAYVVLGFMIIGIALGNAKKIAFDAKFLSVTFFAKFIAWPLIVLLIIFIDKNFIQFFEGYIHNIFLAISVTPLAANTVSVATIFHIKPEKCALAVMLSTLFALIYIPIVLSFWI